MRFWRATSWLLWAGLALGPSVAVRAAAPATNGAESPIEQALGFYRQGDFPGAQRAFQRLAGLGVAAAAYNLGVMHLRGELPDASPAQAVRWMSQAAAQGFVTAMVGLAQLHERGELDGRRDLATAQRWYLMAAQAGSVDAQVEAATAYYLGRGTPKDLPAAAHWYREAAKGGDSGAQYLLASMYEHGHGVPRDLRLARYWYEQCASGGDVAAAGKFREMDARLSQDESD